MKKPSLIILFLLGVLTALCALNVGFGVAELTGEANGHPSLAFGSATFLGLSAAVLMWVS